MPAKLIKVMWTWIYFKKKPELKKSYLKAKGLVRLKNRWGSFPKIRNYTKGYQKRRQLFDEPKVFDNTAN